MSAGGSAAGRLAAPAVCGRMAAEQSPPPEERMSTTTSTTIDVGSWFATLARNWWVIVGLVVLGIVVGAVVTLAQPKEYTATASVYIGQTTDATGNPMAGLNSNAKAAVQLLASQVVLKEAAERTGMDISASRLRRETTVETPSSTVKTTTSVVNIVVISVTDTDAERAAAAANALSEVLLERLESGVDEKIAVLEKQLADNQKAYAASLARSVASPRGARRHRQGRRLGRRQGRRGVAPGWRWRRRRRPSRNPSRRASSRRNSCCFPRSRTSSRASCTRQPSRTRRAARP